MYTLANGQQVETLPNTYTGLAANLTSPTKYWFKEGKYHRVDGPAIIEKRNKIYVWYHHGKCHRIGGHAWFYYNNKEYFIYNIVITNKSKILLLK
jgi:hypothetical protein